MDAVAATILAVRGRLCWFWLVYDLATWIDQDYDFRFSVLIPGRW